MAGAGGFINISQNAKKVVFVGTFSACGLEVQIKDGKLGIIKEGTTRKFVNEVEHRTFSGEYAAKSGREILYVTERCVFRLMQGAQSLLELIEIAPGIDLQRDILAQMDFAPRISANLKTMDARIFVDATMDLRKDLLALPLDKRFMLDDSRNRFYINFEGLYINKPEQIEKIKELVIRRLSGRDKKVLAIVNYDNFSILPELMDKYADMVKDVVPYYANVTRYTTSAFMRSKLGKALEKRHVAPHIYESEKEAEAGLGLTS